MSDKDIHPCFNKESSGTCGRVHLPVAPKCNIQCNYCNRKYDCVNESRPGVSSAVLTPAQALEYVDELVEEKPWIRVVGIAGPGDPFANADKTLETLRLIRAKHPDLVFCISTNGLEVSPHIAELKALGVSHMTVTLNAIDAERLKSVYAWVRFRKRVYRGLEGAQVLLREQLGAIQKLKENGFKVKVNMIIVPGVNDDHVSEVAHLLKEMKVDLMNCMPLHPTADTPFEDLPEPSPEQIAGLRKEAGFMEQMTHCQRCRADAVGLLGQDDQGCLNKMQTIAFAKEKVKPGRPYVAVATHEGLLVNRHLGEADFVQIFTREDDHYVSLERRLTPPGGNGDQRWLDMAEMLKDCSAIIVSGVGHRPHSVLTEQGVEVIEMNGLIEEGLDAVYKGIPLRASKPRSEFRCGDGCSGQGLGCA